MPPSVVDFLIDDENEDKFAAHRISVEQVPQVLHGRHTIVQSRASRRAFYVMVGLDYGGRCVAIPIEPIDDPTVWRPVTTWPCKASERRLLR